MAFPSKEGPPLRPDCAGIHFFASATQCRSASLGAQGGGGILLGCLP